MTNNICLPERSATLRVMPMPRDTNAAGDIFGGWIMSQVDMAGSIAAVSCARGRVVTVAVNAFKFMAPAYVDDVVSFYAEIIKIGTTSITVKVEVYVERGLNSQQLGEVAKITEAILTYVAVDENRRKRPVIVE